MAPADQVSELETAIYIAMLDAATERLRAAIGTDACADGTPLPELASEIATACFEAAKRVADHESAIR